MPHVDTLQPPEKKKEILPQVDTLYPPAKEKKRKYYPTLAFKCIPHQKIGNIHVDYVESSPASPWQKKKLLAEPSIYMYLS